MTFSAGASPTQQAGGFLGVTGRDWASRASESRWDRVGTLDLQIASLVLFTSDKSMNGVEIQSTHRDLPCKQIFIYRNQVEVRRMNEVPIRFETRLKIGELRWRDAPRYAPF